MTDPLPVDLFHLAFLLDHCSTRRHARLPLADQARIVAVVAEPTVEAWEAAHDVRISPLPPFALWSAVRDVDQSFQSTADRHPGPARWKRAPEPAVILEAIRRAVLAPSRYDDERLCLSCRHRETEPCEQYCAYGGALAQALDRTRFPFAVPTWRTA